MKRTSLLVAGSVIAAGAIAGTAYMRTGHASDHDDGEIDLKSRALNLTDNFAFKSGNDLSLVLYTNPRSLPGRQYYLSPNARYELHVSRAASRTTAPTAADDYVFRFEASPPMPTGNQMITLTILANGTVVGTHSGMSTPFGASKANTVVTNSGTVGSFDVDYFVGQRADSFYFDVNRFFEVRAFLAQRFFGNGTTGDNTATLAPNCNGQGLLSETGGPVDADGVNLWNPPSCAPDFTKGLNVTAIVLNVSLASLSGEIFDTWSTISVKE